MQQPEHISQLLPQQKRKISYYLLDTFLATFGVFIFTGAIYTARLYPSIPDILVLYLLLILPLAILRSSYSAILTAILAALAFDFFLVPPLYTFTIDNWHEWVALFAFLVTALVVSLLSANVRRSADAANLRERQARILYELMRVTNDAQRLDDQLDEVALSIVRVFSSWGIRECAIVLPEADGQLKVRADAPIQLDDFVLAIGETEDAYTVLKTGETLDRAAKDQQLRLRLIPLKTPKQVFGVLLLRIESGKDWRANTVSLEDERQRSGPDANFFWTFIDQATSLIERGLLRSQVMTQQER